MALTVEEIYRAASPLSAREKFLLACRLLGDIPSESVVDCGETWSEADIREATLYSLKFADASQAQEKALCAAQDESG